MIALKKKMHSNKSFPGFSFVQSKKDFSEYLLKVNGLRVLYKHTPGTETVTTNMVYMVGSRHEPRGETGITHMLEHMMFKPTGENGKKDKTLGWKELEDAGALMNANTWLDRTSYFFCMPHRYFANMLKVEARRMRNIFLENEEFLPERANVLSEYEMYAGRPDAILEATTMGAAYVSHTYGHDTLGHKPDIEAYTTEKLRRYYDVFYWPNNAYLIIVGDIPLEKALKEVRQAFKAIPSSPAPIPDITIIEPEQQGTRRVTIERPSPINILSMNYKSVAAQHADWVPLHVLISHLGEGALSVLEKKLVDTHKASSVLPYQQITHDAFLLGFQIYLTKGTDHNDVETIVRNEIAYLKKHPLPQKTLERIKTGLIASELYARDGGFSETALLTEYIASGDWTRYFTMLNDIKKTTPKDIQRVASTYFTPTRETIGICKGTV